MVYGVLGSVFGAVFASVACCAPGLHVYNLLGAGAILAWGGFCPEGMFVPIALGMITGFAVTSTIPSVILAAPDESAFFMVLPGQKYLMSGRGYEAVLLTAMGSTIGLVVMVPALVFFGPDLRPVYSLFREHAHWVIWCVICFMLMSEWPKETRPGCFGWRQFLQAWKALAAGLATFLMSGLLGFLLIYRAPVPAESAFQNLMPAFVGLFTMPWLLINLVTATRAPAQNCTIPAITADRLLAGGVAGSLGGGFAAFVPVITGGVGGFLAGHATGVRNDQVFLVSQGASKVVYYTGAALLLFVPGLNLVRGGGGIIMNAFHSPFSHSEFLYAAGCVAVAAAVSLSMVMPLTRMILWLVAKAGMRMLSLISLCVVVGLVFLLARLAGIGVMLTALGIGLVPVLFGSRRMNCLGIILLPIASMMSGIGDDIARLLGLI